MLYPQQIRKKNQISNVRFVVIIFFVILILVYVFDKKIITYPFQGVAIKINLFANKVGDFLPNTFSVFFDKNNLYKENRILKDKYENFNLICTAFIKSLEAENLELNNALNRKKDISDPKSVTAFVIGKPPLTPYDTLMIDVGESDGIKVGDIVLHGKMLIGKIEEVFNDRSSLRIYGKKGEDLNLLIGEKRLMIVGKGLGMGVVNAKIVNDEDDFLKQVVRIQHNAGYVFGFVDSIQNSIGEKYQDLTIKSPINVFELNSVEVIHNDQ